MKELETQKRNGLKDSLGQTTFISELPTKCNFGTGYWTCIKSSTVTILKGELNTGGWTIQSEIINFESTFL